ncbi:hypothetical protein, partial [Burkholderia sp. BCC1985]|uniref:hypothetical protein n=1 Tax=Burkholderia sp. BCC1985 TaxID=2817442 RepID=UPI002AB243B3
MRPKRDDSFNRRNLAGWLSDADADSAAMARTARHNATPNRAASRKNVFSRFPGREGRRSAFCVLRSAFCSMKSQIAQMN